jgi:azurin
MERKLHHNSEDRLGDYTGGFPFVGNVQDTKVSFRKSTGNVQVNNATAVQQKGNSQQISLSVVPDMMQYTEKLIKVKAGEKVVIFFDNPDGMQHNLLIIKPGTLQKVGKAADDMLRDPKAADKQYVPASSDVLHYTRLLNTGESVTLEFTAPDKPGDYPYVCTFPGHWRGMNGILRVEK